MKILGIETSCDETAAAVVEKIDNKIVIHSNVIASSLSLHAKTGGIIPEFAAREQIKAIIPVIEKALSDAKIKGIELDAIAVTVGPGLIGSLLVGVETAKTLSMIWNKPLIPVNHLFGHIYANWLIANGKWQIEKPYAISHKPSAEIQFPALALIVSGNHTDLVLIKNHNNIEWLGGTRDDAAGEAFDKTGRLLGLNYPAGPTISKLAEKGDPKAYTFPRPMIGSGDFDFSFSGLKTAVMNQVRTIEQPASPYSPRGEAGASQGGLNNETIANLCASIEQAIVDVIVKKTLKAAQKYGVKSILLGGGVAANEKLRTQLKLSAISHMPSAKVFAPAKNLCTDNAAMITSAAFYIGKPVPLDEITANPELYFD